MGITLVFLADFQQALKIIFSSVKHK